MHSTTILFVLSLSHIINAQNPNPPNPHWDYEREGPDTWQHTYETCEGEAQSPIDIRTSQVKYDSSLTPLVLNGYITNMSTTAWNFTHNGHTIVASPSPFARITMSGGGLTDTFLLNQFHFHWGYNAFQGSEHTINGRKYPLEVHFVHRSQFTGQLAVLGILFDRQRDDNPHLNGLLSILNRTVNTSISVEQQIDLSRLLPSTPSPRFYRYNGSLTTPPCTEGVIWTIFSRTVPISSYQLNVLMNNVVPFNFRPPQKLHLRKVIANFRPEPQEGAEEEEYGGHHSLASFNQITILQVILPWFLSSVVVTVH